MIRPENDGQEQKGSLSWVATASSLRAVTSKPDVADAEKLQNRSGMIVDDERLTLLAPNAEKPNVAGADGADVAAKKPLRILKWDGIPFLECNHPGLQFRKDILEKRNIYPNWIPKKGEEVEVVGSHGVFRWYHGKRA